MAVVVDALVGSTNSVCLLQSEGKLKISANCIETTRTGNLFIICIILY